MPRTSKQGSSQVVKAEIPPKLVRMRDWPERPRPQVLAEARPKTELTELGGRLWIGRNELHGDNPLAGAVNEATGGQCELKTVRWLTPRRAELAISTPIGTLQYCCVDDLSEDMASYLQEEPLCRATQPLPRSEATELRRVDGHITE